MIDREDKTMEVPDLTVPDVLLSTPRVWFARSALEYRSLAADSSAPATLLREFRRTDRLLLRFDAFTPASAPATVTGELLNQQGDRMLDVTVTPPAAAGQPFLVDLSLANLAAGQYLLRLTAAAEGHEPANEFVAFRVTN